MYDRPFETDCHGRGSIQMDRIAIARYLSERLDIGL
jgi:hypothetical protein